MAIKKLVLFVTGLMFILLVQGSSFAKQQVTVIGDANYPPYSYLENGQPKGVYVDILTAAFARMPEYQVKIIMLPWKNGINAVKTGKHAAIFPPYFNEDRKSWMIFSEPILKEEIVVFGKEGKLAGKNVWPEDFYGHKFGLNMGFSAVANGGQKFAAAVSNGKIKLEIVGNKDQNLKKLNADRIDFYLGDKMIDVSQFPIVKRGVVANVNDGYLGFTSKTENFEFIPAFKKEFDSIIKQMKISGKIENIVQSYMK